MPITSHLLSKSCNKCVVIPAWATFNDWLDIAACEPRATPLIDFGEKAVFRVGATALNWFLMDLFGLRWKWLCDGWMERSEIWLLINPLRYRLLGHPPKRPYALDVRDYIAKTSPHLLYETLAQHAYFALLPLLHKDDHSDAEAEARAAVAPWSRVAVLNKDETIIGMVWSPGVIEGKPPPILKTFSSFNTASST